MEDGFPVPPRRDGTTAVHSLHRFVFGVPDLEEAAAFYSAFGLDVRRGDARLDLYTAGHSHCWGSIHRREGPKQLEYVSFGLYADDMAPMRERCARLSIPLVPPHERADEEGIWMRDPEGTLVQLVIAPKVSPSAKSAPLVPVAVPGRGAAPIRSAIGPVRPRRLSHVLLFSSDVQRSVRFYTEVLGLRLSDCSRDIIAFLHGAHASDHHMLAFAKSDGPGLHHSSWDVASIDEVGLGMQQMADRGFARGWGVGRHVIGSNYFRYVQDPWGSFAEYSYDIDFIPVDVDWPAGDYAPEDSFYVWGPPVPDDFIVNHESAARRSALERTS